MIATILTLVAVAGLCWMCYVFGCNKAYDKGYRDGHDDAVSFYIYTKQNQEE